MAKRLTKEEFIEKAHIAHGDKYDYSKVEYVNSITPVCIICPIHGEFLQKPHTHLNKKGCKKCFLQRKKSLVCGKGVNDCVSEASIHGEHKKSYSIWKAMIYRCYDERYHNRYPSYSDCSVCKEWLYYSNFKSWFDKNYKEGFHLDKDILFQGNKIYSPNTCVFVPAYINTITGDSKAKRGEYKLGVSWNKERKKFTANVNVNKKHLFLGYFKDEELAFEEYKKIKREEIIRVAKDFYEKGQINKRTYLALLNFEIK